MTLEDVAMLKEKLGELDDFCHDRELPPLGIFWRLKAFLRALLRAPAVMRITARMEERKEEDENGT